MIKTALAGVLLAAVMAAPTGHNKDSPKYESLGEWRITTYCEECNEPVGHQSSSGRYLEYGQVAMNGVPLGSIISIDGAVFEVTDRCGIDDTVDIFVESGDGCCHCDVLDYKEVYIKRR